jgi:cellulose biosynthesis protein BcsQ
MKTTIATINFKGGVGKTTVTWCLGDVLSTYSSNVLLFDLDAQMSLTQAIALDAEGNSSGQFASWKESSVKHDRTNEGVIANFRGLTWRCWKSKIFRSKSTAVTF